MAKKGDKARRVNPGDAERRREKQKQLAKNKQERSEARALSRVRTNPEQAKEEYEQYEKLSKAKKLDNTGKKKWAELQKLKSAIDHYLNQKKRCEEISKDSDGRKEVQDLAVLAAHARASRRGGIGGASMLGPRSERKMNEEDESYEYYSDEDEEGESGKEGPRGKAIRRAQYGVSSIKEEIPSDDDEYSDPSEPEGPPPAIPMPLFPPHPGLMMHGGPFIPPNRMMMMMPPNPQMIPMMNMGYGFDLSHQQPHPMIPNPQGPYDPGMPIQPLHTSQATTSQYLPSRPPVEPSQALSHQRPAFAPVSVQLQNRSAAMKIRESTTQHDPSKQLIGLEAPILEDALGGIASAPKALSGLSRLRRKPPTTQTQAAQMTMQPTANIKPSPHPSSNIKLNTPSHQVRQDLPASLSSLGLGDQLSRTINTGKHQAKNKEEELDALFQSFLEK